MQLRTRSNSFIENKTMNPNFPNPRRIRRLTSKDFAFFSLGTRGLNLGEKNLKYWKGRRWGRIYSVLVSDPTDTMHYPCVFSVRNRTVCEVLSCVFSSLNERLRCFQETRYGSLSLFVSFLLVPLPSLVFFILFLPSSLIHVESQVRLCRYAVRIK